MLLIDVNILVNAFRPDSTRHPEYRRWMEEMLASNQLFGLTDSVKSGFLRITTHPGIFHPPAPIEDALGFLEALESSGSYREIAPSKDHWRSFVDMCITSGVKGDLVPDAYLATLAIESGAELITADRGFARFPGLKWRHPLISRGK